METTKSTGVNSLSNLKGRAAHTAKRIVNAMNEDTDAVIPPINDPAPLAPSRLPSLLGEVMTVIRGTLRLYKASK